MLDNEAFLDDRKPEFGRKVTGKKNFAIGTCKSFNDTLQTSRVDLVIMIDDP